jgi:hypothetical protein
VVDLREGQRVRAVIDGTVTEDGNIQISSVRSVGMRGARVYISPSQCVSVEPAPVVVETGKWYCPADNDQSEYCYYGMPGGAVQCYYVGRGLNRWGNNPPSEYQGRLMECDPPAEFRDGA